MKLSDVQLPKTAKPRAIVLHWTVGRNKANSTDLAHYHFVVEGDGNILAGNHTILDNENTSDGDYAAHCLGFNTRTIGISLCGMMGSKESPFQPGPEPIKANQFEMAARLAAKMCLQYGLTPTRTTVLSHAEVQPNLGIRQRGKWDVTRLPWNPNISGAGPCGDLFRDMVSSFMRPEEPASSMILVNLKINGSVIAPKGVLEDGETLVPVRDLAPLLPFTYTVGAVDVENRRVEIKPAAGGSHFLDLVILGQKGHIGLRDLIEAILPFGKTVSYGFVKGSGGSPSTVEVTFS